MQGFLVHFDDRYWVMFPMTKLCFFPISRRNSQFKEQNKLSPFCALLTALCHSKLYFCIPNFVMALLVDQIFDFFVLFDYIIQCEFFPILYKMMRKIPISGARVMFPKWGEKNPDMAFEKGRVMNELFFELSECALLIFRDLLFLSFSGRIS